MSYYREIPRPGNFKFLHDIVHMVVNVNIFRRLLQEIPYMQPAILAPVEHFRADVPQFDITLETFF